MVDILIHWIYYDQRLINPGIAWKHVTLGLISIIYD